MANVHADAYGNLHDAVVLAICGRTASNVERLAQRIGAIPTARFEDLLDDPAIHAIDICVPTPQHRRFVVAALEGGKHVFCETPLALSIEDATAMRDAARANDRLLLVGLLMRSVSHYGHIERAVSSGSLGRPIAASAYRLGSYLWPSATDHKDHYSDPTTELMTFDIDVLNWIFGVPRAAFATAAEGPGGRPGHVFATLEYDHVVASVEASGLMPSSFPFSIGFRIVGELGALDLTTRFTDEASPPVSALIAYPLNGGPVAVDIPDADPYETECRFFLDCVHGRTDPGLLDVERALEALRACLAVPQSLREHRRVTIP